MTIKIPFIIKLKMKILNYFMTDMLKTKKVIKICAENMDIIMMYF